LKRKPWAQAVALVRFFGKQEHYLEHCRFDFTVLRRVDIFEYNFPR